MKRETHAGYWKTNGVARRRRNVVGWHKTWPPFCFADFAFSINDNKAWPFVCVGVGIYFFSSINQCLNRVV